MKAFLPIVLSVALAPLLAALFVGGCAAIHALRRHAERVTPVLLTLALCLGGVLALTATMPEPAPGTAGLADPPACYGFE